MITGKEALKPRGSILNKGSTEVGTRLWRAQTISTTPACHLLNQQDMVYFPQEATVYEMCLHPSSPILGLHFYIQTYTHPVFRDALSTVLGFQNRMSTHCNRISNATLCKRGVLKSMICVQAQLAIQSRWPQRVLIEVLQLQAFEEDWKKHWLLNFFQWGMMLQKKTGRDSRASTNLSLPYRKKMF